MTKFYGFTFMRGVDKLDYPYMEMLESMSGLVDEIYLALGDSEDKTGERVKTLGKVKVIDTVWEDKYMGDGGMIFSQQANVALDELRKDHGNEDDAWAIFLHCDEIIHPSEYKKLKEDIEAAIASGADAVRLRFLHYWKDHYHIAVNKRWQPAEIRAFKLKSDIICHGDAQGFSGYKKQVDSDVCLYHYGHVRPAEQHKLKQEEIMRRIRPAAKFNKYWSREKKAFAKTKMQKVLIEHPSFMKERVERLRDPFELETKKVVYIVGDYTEFSEDITSKINADEVNFVLTSEEVPFEHRFKNMVIMKPSLMERIQYDQPKSVDMESDLASSWSKDFELILRLSNIDVSVKL
ncbi:hypothetical protein HBN50_05210 [Halobacteriovorax sp. GB3]|uniref:hypothetical protein n=1 Tax=Halobacteriovorax sp. GB3 TaxID=2719615 RepID=UPI00235EDB27|nr:hypothetical protein [Halobacteriovorax sp. GB3]MDD0852484.1 hypothetical protein [Halobacteriovorax sp. GB3]